MRRRFFHAIERFYELGGEIFYKTKGEKWSMEKAQNLIELSRFLAKLNNQKQFHIGYCGEVEEEIYKTLKEDFVHEKDGISFWIAKNQDGVIITAIGLDIGTSAEVWGPFLQIVSLPLQHQLWEQVVKGNSSISEFYFFVNKENITQQQFLNEIGAAKTGEHLILEIQKENFHEMGEIRSKPYEERDYPTFEKLHFEMFPNTYYDAKTIINRLSEHCILKVLKSEMNDVVGYAYYEIDSEIGEASLEYLAISPKAQNQGLGTLLLKEVLTEMFSHSHITEIRLSVNNQNNRANHVYFKAGFEQKHILYSYQFHRRVDEDF